MGQWVERGDRSWGWDPTPADPSVTRIMSAYAGGSPMPEHAPRDVPRSVYDPDLGSDGGGRYADPDPIPSIDPDKPVDHVDQLGVGPAHWTGTEPRDLDDLMYGSGEGWPVPSARRDVYDQATRERGGGRLTDPVTEDVAVCPCCGTVVAAGRLRG